MSLPLLRLASSATASSSSSASCSSTSSRLLSAARAIYSLRFNPAPRSIPVALLSDIAPSTSSSSSSSSSSLSGNSAARTIITPLSTLLSKLHHRRQLHHQNYVPLRQEQECLKGDALFAGANTSNRNSSPLTLTRSSSRPPLSRPVGAAARGVFPVNAVHYEPTKFCGRASSSGARMTAAMASRAYPNSQTRFFSRTPILASSYHDGSDGSDSGNDGNSSDSAAVLAHPPLMNAKPRAKAKAKAKAKPDDGQVASDRSQYTLRYLSSSSSACAHYSTADEDEGGDGATQTVPFPCSHYQYFVPPSPYQIQDDDKIEENSVDYLSGPEPSYVKANYGYKVFKHDQPFQCFLEDNPNGGVIENLQLAYETWGTLNRTRDNCVLIHTGLSASSHAKSHPANTTTGWWEKFIGPGKAIDTDRFFVVCSNNLGGCFGSTGPSSVNPQTGRPYGTQFPIITVRDMVTAQFLLLDHLGIDKLHASVGASLGGMQSLLACQMHPERINRCISISGAHKSHPTAIALRYMQRRVIMADPHWKGGMYYYGNFPLVGMKHAREIATISYRSGPEWEQRFSRRRVASASKQRSFMPEYLIETYIDHQGTSAASRYDPNSLLYISKAMDMFDMEDGYSSAEEALDVIKCPTLVIGVQSDFLFPVQQQRELSEVLKRTGNESVVYYELDALYGHDTFLIDVNTVGAAMKGHLEHNIF